MNKEKNIKDLFAKAKQASKKAYAPYSKMHVGAVLVTEKGNTYTGCNVENASFGLTTCAERNAISAAVNSEGTGMKIKFIAVAIENDLPIPPCGACRQVIAEFSNQKTTGVIFKTSEGKIECKKITDLLPEAFKL